MELNGAFSNAVYVPAGDVAAFSITQDSVLTIWNVALGLAVMLWAFGYTQMRALLSRSGAKQVQGQAEV